MKTTLKVIIIVLVLASFGFGIYAIVQSQEKKKLLEEIKAKINPHYLAYFEPYLKKMTIPELKIFLEYVIQIKALPEGEKLTTDIGVKFDALLKKYSIIIPT